MAKSSGSTYATIEKGLVELFYIMYGQDNFSLYGELQKIKMGLGNPEMLAINTNVLDGRQLSLGQLSDTCNTMPFLHQNRLVIVEGLLERFEPKKKSDKRTSKPQAKFHTELKEWQELGSYTKKMPEKTILILIDGKLDEKRNTLLKHLRLVAKVKKFPELKDEDLYAWIEKRITAGKGRASNEAIELLKELVGSDLWSMDSEIEKLLIYSQGGPITRDDVRRVTSYTREDDIFDLVDAILQCHRRKSQQLLHRLLLEGVVPPYILTMITRQLRLVLIYKELDPTMPDQEAMDRLGINKVFVLRKVKVQAKVHSTENIKRAFHRVLEADMAMKTGKYDDELAIELLVIDLCQTRL